MNKSKWLQCIFDEDTFFARFALVEEKEKKTLFASRIANTRTDADVVDHNLSNQRTDARRVSRSVPMSVVLAVLFPCRPNWNMHTEYPNGVFYAEAHRCRIIVIRAMVGADGWIGKTEK